MGTVSSMSAGMSAGMTDFMQTLTSAGSPLSSTALQSVLRNSSPADVVKLSYAVAANRRDLRSFGHIRSSSSGDLLSALTNLAQGPAQGTSAGTSAITTSATTKQFAAAEATLEEEQTAALFNTNTDSLSSNSLSVMG